MNAYVRQPGEESPGPRAVHNRNVVILAIAICLALFIQIIVRPIIWASFPSFHPACKVSKRANKAFKARDFKWLIDHTDPEEVTRDGLTADLLEKVVNIVYDDGPDPLLATGYGTGRQLVVRRGSKDGLVRVSEPLFFQDINRKLLVLSLEVYPSSSSGEIKGLLGSILGGTLIDYRQSLVIPSSKMRTLTNAQLAALRKLGIKRVSYPTEEGSRSVALADAPDRQNMMRMIVNDYSVKLLK